jgi:hypothetical protein
LDVRPGWWVGFVAADLTLYWGYFRSLHDGGRYGAYSISHQALFVGAWWRIGMLALLAVVFLRSTTAIDHEIARSQHTVPSPAPATSR